MKTCTKCGVEKDYLDFYKRADSPDGFAYRCKVCMSAHTKAWQQANSEEIAAYKKAYRQANPEKVAAMVKACRQANPEQVAATAKANRLKYPEKYKARAAVSDAVKAGRLTRPQECSSCTVSCKPDGHHDDYGKPLDVRWLCTTCHVAHHNKLNELKEA